MEIPQDIRNIFSRRALAALNACARFCYNMCMGWGISLKKGDGYVAVGIDQKQLLSWLKDERFATSCPKDVPTGATAADVTAVASRAPEDVKRAYQNENATDTTPTEPESGNSGDNKIARIGTSKFAALADHVHRDLALHDKVQKPTGMLYNDSNDGGKLKYKAPKFDRGGRYLGLDNTGAALAVHLANICGGSTAGVLATDATGAVNVKGIGNGANQVAPGDHTHTASQISGLPSVPSDVLKASDFPTSGSGNNGTATTPARSDHTHDIGAMPCTISGHTGNCLLVVGPPDASGKASVTHSGNNMYNAADSLTSALQAAGTTALLTRNTSKGITAIAAGSNNTVLCVGSGGALEWKSASSLAPSASAVAGELAGDATAISGIAAVLAADSSVVSAIAAEVETDVDDEDVAAAVAEIVASSVTPTASDVASIVADNVEANVTPSTAQVASAVAAEIADGIAENIDVADVEAGVITAVAANFDTTNITDAAIVAEVASGIDTTNITEAAIVTEAAEIIAEDVGPTIDAEDVVAAVAGVIDTTGVTTAAIVAEVAQSVASGVTPTKLQVANAVASLVSSSVTPTTSAVADAVADIVVANVTPTTAQVTAAVAANIDTTGVTTAAIVSEVASGIDTTNITDAAIVTEVASGIDTTNIPDAVVAEVAGEIDTSNITDQDIISATAALIHSDVTDADIADAVEEALETNNAANAVNALASDYSSGLPYVKRSDIGSASGLQVDAQNNNAVSVKLATNKGLEVLTGNNPGLAVKLETNGGIAVGNDGLKLETLHQTTLNLANMLTCTNNGNGSYTLSFFPPQVDGRGRITGLAQNAAWSVALLEDA